MFSRWFKALATVSVVMAVTLLSGCAATQLAITKRDLSVSTKSSASIFLDPVPDRQKVVYVQVRNTSGVPSYRIRSLVLAQLHQRGYRTTTHLNHAHFLLQANVLKVSEVSKTAARAVMGSSFGSALAGGALTATVGALAGASGSSVVGLGLLGGAASALVDNMVKDVNMVAVADVQISVRTNDKIEQYNKSELRQGTSSVSTQRSYTKPHWKRYRTRVVVHAEKVNLHYAQARGPMERSMAAAIAGYF